MSVAVNEAIRERSERICGSFKKVSVDRILKIGECASHLKEPYKSVEHGNLLYGKKGLPK
jgi:antitoxin VapB